MDKKHVALRINGDRPHFVRKRSFSYRKWGLSPFIWFIFSIFSPYSLRQTIIMKRSSWMMEKTILRFHSIFHDNFVII